MSSPREEGRGLEEPGGRGPRQQGSPEGVPSQLALAFPENVTDPGKPAAAFPVPSAGSDTRGHQSTRGTSLAVPHGGVTASQQRHSSPFPVWNEWTPAGSAPQLGRVQGDAKGARIKERREPRGQLSGRTGPSRPSPSLPGAHTAELPSWITRSVTPQQSPSNRSPLTPGLRPRCSLHSHACYPTISHHPRATKPG